MFPTMAKLRVSVKSERENTDNAGQKKRTSTHSPVNRGRISY